MKESKIRLWIFIISLISVFMYALVSVSGYGFVSVALMFTSGGRALTFFAVAMPWVLTIVSFIGLVARNMDYKKPALILLICSVIDLISWIGIGSAWGSFRRIYGYGAGGSGFFIFLTFVFILFILFCSLMIFLGKMDTDTGLYGFIGNIKGGNGTASQGRPQAGSTRPARNSNAANANRKPPVDPRVRTTSASDYNSRNYQANAYRSAAGTTQNSTSGQPGAQLQSRSANAAPIYHEEPSVQSAVSGAQPAAGTKVCGNCGSPLQENDVFCMSCGTKYVEPPKEELVYEDAAFDGSEAEMNGKICPACGNIMKEGDVFCGNCGTKYAEPVKRICPGCGRELKEDQVFCPMCGTRYEETKETAEEPAEKAAPEQAVDDFAWSMEKAMEDPVPAPVLEEAAEAAAEPAEEIVPEQAANDFAWSVEKALGDPVPEPVLEKAAEIVEEAADAAPEVPAEDAVPEDFYKIPAAEDLQKAAEDFKEKSDFIAIE